MKWIISTIITIILVPRLQPIVSEYIESQFINSFGLGIVIFIFSLLISIYPAIKISKLNPVKSMKV